MILFVGVVVLVAAVANYVFNLNLDMSTFAELFMMLLILGTLGEINKKLWFISGMLIGHNKKDKSDK